MPRASGLQKKQQAEGGWAEGCWADEGSWADYGSWADGPRMDGDWVDTSSPPPKKRLAARDKTAHKERRHAAPAAPSLVSYVMAAMRRTTAKEAKKGEKAHT